MTDFKWLDKIFRQEIGKFLLHFHLHTHYGVRWFDLGLMIICYRIFDSWLQKCHTCEDLLSLGL